MEFEFEQLTARERLACPAGTGAAAAGAARQAWEVPGATGLTVHLSFGDVSGQSCLDQLTTDLVVHTWDLAQGTGKDTRLPGDLVDFAPDRFAGCGDLSGSGLFDPPLPAPEDASPQTRLPALPGRRDG
ncbi:TIGR03086 family metal-binding protein [Kitasatospora aureofaciens]|uniref:TIGR03086 family metal-binding protein n=1 Tax=Kitasatospora aureofaciens TaxID=1894 RepID=UPI0037CB0980